MSRTLEEALRIYGEYERLRRSLELLSELGQPKRSGSPLRARGLPVPGALEERAGCPAEPVQITISQGGYHLAEARLVLVIDIEDIDPESPVLKPPLPDKVDVLLEGDPLRVLKANIDLAGIKGQLIEFELPEDLRSRDCWRQFDEQPLGDVELPLRFLLHW